jgi:NADH-quinone oxidoreductase subunit E
MLEVAPQVIYAIIALLAICIFLYILKETSKGDNNCYKRVENSTIPIHINYKPSTHKKAKENNSKKPILLSKPKNGEKDNLQLIKGIGNVLEKVLNDMGVFHFEQIANWTEKEINWIDKSIAFPGRIQREKWVEQAKKLFSEKKN